MTKLHENFTKHRPSFPTQRQGKAHKIVKSKKNELEIKLITYPVYLAVWNLTPLQFTGSNLY